MCQLNAVLPASFIGSMKGKTLYYSSFKFGNLKLLADINWCFFLFFFESGLDI